MYLSLLKILIAKDMLTVLLCILYSTSNHTKIQDTQITYHLLLYLSYTVEHMIVVLK